MNVLLLEVLVINHTPGIVSPATKRLVSCAVNPLKVSGGLVIARSL